MTASRLRRFGTPANPPPSAAVAGQCPPAICPRGGRSKRARWAAATDAARQTGRPPQQEYEEQEPEYQPSPVHPLHRGPAGRPAAASEQDHHDQGADKQPVDPSPYDHALYGRVKSVERENARDPAYAMLTAKMQRAGFEKNGLTPGAGTRP